MIPSYKSLIYFKILCIKAMVFGSLAASHISSIKFLQIDFNIFCYIGPLPEIRLSGQSMFSTGRFSTACLAVLLASIIFCSLGRVLIAQSNQSGSTSSSGALIICLWNLVNVLYTGSNYVLGNVFTCPMRVSTDEMALLSSTCQFFRTLMNSAQSLSVIKRVNQYINIYKLRESRPEQRCFWIFWQNLQNRPILLFNIKIAINNISYFNDKFVQAIRYTYKAQDYVPCQQVPHCLHEPKSQYRNHQPRACLSLTTQKRNQSFIA